jgi:hypothetical protein
MSTSSALNKQRDNPPAGPVSESCLYLAFDGNHPTLATWRYHLEAVDEVLIGRDRRREVNLRHNDGVTRLTLGFPDPWMSTEHMIIRRGDRGLEMTDLHSKNGSSINRTIRDSAVLTDGDLLQLGRTFFVLREALPGQAGEPVHMCPTMDAPPGLLTVLLPLEQRFVDFAQAASTNVPLVLLGATGTGKSLLAHTAHAIAGSPGPLVDIRLADMRVSELERRLAECADAEHGTLLLDGLDGMSSPVQAALLDILNRRDKSSQKMVATAGWQLIATCSRPLDDLLAARTLKRELVTRLSGFTLELPPLHQRREDLGLLVASILAHYAPGQSVSFTAEAMEAMLCYPWPRNIRELSRAIGVALALCGDDPIDLNHLPPELQRPLSKPNDPNGDTLDTIELSEQAIQKRAKIMASLRDKDQSLSASTDLRKIQSQFQAWLARRQMRADTSNK